MKPTAVIRVASQASRIEQRHVVDEVAVDLVVFDQNRLTVQLGEVLPDVLKLRGRPIEIDQPVRAVVFVQ
jgi:hypothetical protein